MTFGNRARLWGAIVGVWVLCCCATAAHAGIVPTVPIGYGGQYLDVQATLGSGSNTSYLVVDFGQTGGQSYAWAYNWNTPSDPSQAPTGETIVVAAESAGLTASISSFPAYGDYVNNFSYSSGVGDPNQYWQYYNGTYLGNTVAWTSAAVGFGEADLTNGSFDGWYNSFDPSAPSPAIPTAAPEPGSLTLLGLGALCLLRRKRA